MEARKQLPAEDAPVQKKSGHIQVRLARTVEDVDALMPLVRAAMAESRYADLPFAEERLRERMVQRLGEPKFVGMIIAERLAETPQPIGLLYAMAGVLPFADGVSCAAHLFYVHPKARASRAAPLLLKAFDLWARNRKAYEAAVHVTMGRADDGRVGALLERYGFLNSGGGSHFKRL